MKAIAEYALMTAALMAAALIGLVLLLINAALTLWFTVLMVYTNA